MNTGSNKILIIDDYDIISRVVSIFLEKLGYEVSIAKTGEKALTLAHENYFIILLDLDLPDIKGLELASMLRKQKHLQSTKIIAFTGNANHNLDYYKLYGFDEVLNKPFNSEKITEIIDKFK